MGNNLKEIRKKITSCKNTQKTTKARKLVSTSKLKRADEMAKKSKVFAVKLNEVFDEMLSRIAASGKVNPNSRLFCRVLDSEVERVDIIFVTADKGLCGGFNVNTIKEVTKLMSELKSKNIKVRLRGIGRKGIEFFAFNNIEIIDKAIGLSSSPDYEKAAEFINRALDDYISGSTDQIILVHNGFKNMISQEIKVRNIIPIRVDIDDTKSKDRVIIAEPDDEEEEILEQLGKRYVEYNIYYSLIDSLAAEHSARMQAMDAATKNAGELVRSLTISYNKARQEAITTELVEINAGVEAMK